MPRKRSNKERYNFLIDKDVYREFSMICDELGLVRSKNLELYMRRFIDDNLEELRRLKKK